MGEQKNPGQTQATSQNQPGKQNPQQERESASRQPGKQFPDENQQPNERASTPDREDDAARRQKQDPMQKRDR